MLSVICPIYNEQKYIARCIDSILVQDYPKDDLEVLFVDGMSSDCTRDIILSYLPLCPYLMVLDNPDRIVPCAMNIGIKAARGDVIMRLDAHARYEPNYFSSLVSRLYELGADDVGSICVTDVLNKTPKTLAIREVLSNKAGVGNSVFRTGVDGVQLVDTVPFGCWKKEVFEKYGLYDERLVRNQDIELSKRIIRGGGRIYIVPDTSCTYYSRETFKELAKNSFSNGKWNILTVYYTKDFNSLSRRHFVPLAFLLSLLIPIIVGLFWRPALWFSLASLSAYLLFIGFISFKLAVKKKLDFLRLIQSFFVLHFSYGWGSLVGIVSLLFLKK